MFRAVQPGGAAACSVTVISPGGSPAACCGPQIASQRAIRETAKHWKIFCPLLKEMLWSLDVLARSWVHTAFQVKGLVML